MTNFSLDLWKYWTSAGLVIAIGAPILIPLAKMKKRKAIYYLLFLSAVLFLSDTTKTTYHQARPFWVDT